MKALIPSNIIDYPFFHCPENLYKFLYILNRSTKMELKTTFMEMIEVLSCNGIDGVNFWFKELEQSGFIKYSAFPNGTIVIKFKKIKKDNDNIIEPIEDRKRRFYQDISNYAASGQYDKKMLRDFFNYWSEMNRCKTKMRFEQQQTWELELRLKRWSQNNLL